MNAFHIRPMKYPWPAFFYLAAILFALAVQHLVPMTLPDGRTLLLRGIGGLVIFIGVYLVAWASVMLFRNGGRAPAKRSSARLVIAGPFRYTRNPIYLGYTLLTIGLGVYADNFWIILTAIAAAVATHLYVIRKEEIHLLARFGYEFERYCRRTRVWI